MTAAGQPGRFVELSYVTADITAAVDSLRRRFGIDRWLELRDVDIDMGSGLSARLHIAVAYLDDILIEVQQPLGGAVDWYRQAVLQHDAIMRPHHLGYVADSAAHLRDLRHWASQTYPVPYFGKFGADSAFFFADARSSLGLYLEYIYFDSQFRNVIPVNTSGPPENPARRLANMRQLAWVTNDYDRALTLWRHHFGFSEFLETGLVETDLGHGQRAMLKVAMAYHHGLQYELIEPVGGDVDIYRQALPSNGDFALCFHHVACAAPNRDALEKWRHQAIRTARHLPIHGAFGESAYFYVDETHQLGHHIEYVYLTPEYDARIPRG